MDTSVPKLSTIQRNILVCIRECVAPLSRTVIAEACGYSGSRGVYEATGWPDLDERRKYDATAKYKSLLGLGYVREVVMDIDGRREVGVLITEAGKRAIDIINTEEASSNVKA